MNSCTTRQRALVFVEKHGVILVSAKGSAPCLTEAIIGEPIKGSWWAHPKSRQIYAIVEAVCNAEEVLVCRLINGKLTLIHRRLWPALVRVAGRFAPSQLAQVRQEHTASGRHVNHEVPFPQWVPGEVAMEANVLEEDVALETFRNWLPSADPSSTRGRGKQ